WSSSTSTTLRLGATAARPFCCPRDDGWCGTAGVYGRPERVLARFILGSMPIAATQPPHVGLACPDCRGSLSGDPLRCLACGREFSTSNGIPELLPRSLQGDTEQRQHALYTAVAHE